MIRSIQATATDFRFILKGSISQFCGKMIQEIDLSSTGLKQKAKILGIVAAVALALLALYWLAQRYCFKATSGSDDKPKLPPPAIPTMPNFEEIGVEDKMVLFKHLEGACEALTEIDSQFCGKIPGQRWDFSQANHGAFLNDIRDLPVISDDDLRFEKWADIFEAYADRLDDAWKPYYDAMLELNPRQEIKDYIQMIYEDELDVIHARLARKCITLGKIGNGIQLVLKMTYLVDARDEILLAVVKYYLDNDMQIGALDLLKEISPSAKSDAVCENYFRRMIKEAHYDQAVTMLLDIEWSQSQLEEKLKMELADVEFANDLEVRLYDGDQVNLSRTKKIIDSLRDGKTKDQFLVKLIQDGKLCGSNAQSFVEKMTFDTALRDRILNNLSKSSYNPTKNIRHPWIKQAK